MKPDIPTGMEAKVQVAAKWIERGKLEWLYLLDMKTRREIARRLRS